MSQVVMIPPPDDGTEPLEPPDPSERSGAPKSQEEHPPSVLSRVWHWLLRALGFKEDATQIKALVALVGVVVFGVSFFFVSYSLAKHKRMVARLTTEVERLQAEGKVKDLRLKSALERAALLQLKKDAAQDQKKRKAIRRSIEETSRALKKADKDLAEKRNRIKHKDSLELLLQKARALSK